MDKKSAREVMRSKLAALSENEYLSLSESVSSNLLDYLRKKTLESNSCDLIVGVYSPIQKEPLWFSEFEDEFKLAVVSIEDDDSLEFYEIELSEIRCGLGLKLDERQKRKKLTPDSIIVPGLAFSENLERLGRGKGYFDKYLEKFSGEKIGICFDFQMMDKIETTELDIEMNLVITDKRIYKVRNIK